MENTAQLRDPNLLTHVFNLKRSLVNRRVKEQTKPSTTLKDQNLIEIAIALLPN
jgi:hypothetical protein